MMEILCQMYDEKLTTPLTTIVLRATNIYGPNDDFKPETSRVTAALLKKVAERQDPIEVWGSGEDVRDHIYVDDAVDAMLMALAKVESYAAFNIGSGRGYSVKEILAVMCEIEGYKDAKTVFAREKPTMIPVRLVDTRKAENILGFKAKTALYQGLRMTLDWYKRRFMRSSNRTELRQ